MDFAAVLFFLRSELLNLIDEIFNHRNVLSLSVVHYFFFNISSAYNLLRFPYF